MFKNYLAVQLRSHRGYASPALIQFQQVYTRQSNWHDPVNAPIYITGFNTNRLFGNLNVVSASETSCAITNTMMRFMSRLESLPQRAHGTSGEDSGG